MPDPAFFGVCPASFALLQPLDRFPWAPKGLLVAAWLATARGVHLQQPGRGLSRQAAMAEPAATPGVVGPANPAARRTARGHFDWIRDVFDVTRLLATPGLFSKESIVKGI